MHMDKMKRGRPREWIQNALQCTCGPYKRAWREAQKEKQQANKAQGQTSIDQAFKKTKK
jgi:hypothetical protein